MILVRTDWAELNNSAWACAQRSFQSPNGSHLPPLRDGRKTSRSLVRMKSGRMGNSKSSKPDSSSSTEDRKSTRLNSSHQIISYAVFCLKKKNNSYTYVEQ